jgi:predicted  nucleic acid-binding Zn-ribbon protein
VLRTSRSKLQDDIDSLKNDKANLEEQRSSLQAEVEIRNQWISAYDRLIEMRFGLNELTFLYDTIMEIAHEKEIPAKNAVSKFLSDVEEQYDRKVGFESKLHSMRDQVSKLGKEYVKKCAELLSNQFIGP